MVVDSIQLALELERHALQRAISLWHYVRVLELALHYVSERGVYLVPEFFCLCLFHLVDVGSVERLDHLLAEVRRRELHLLRELANVEV